MNSATLDTYNAAATAYIDNTPAEVSGEVKKWIDKTLAMVDKSGKIIEIGSAFGRDADYIESKGYTVERTDGAQSFVDILVQKGHSATRFDILNDAFSKKYDLVFANAVLLHFPPEEFRNILKKVKEALTSQGVLAFSMKVKVDRDEEWTNEKVGAPRYFRYWTLDNLKEELRNAGFTHVDIAQDRQFLQVIAKTG
jgi:SAM-dependent methyltransferase